MDWLGYPNQLLYSLNINYKIGFVAREVTGTFKKQASEFNI